MRYLTLGEVDQDRLMLDLAAGGLSRDVLTAWVKAHIVPV
jgi:hypothetical protein